MTANDGGPAFPFEFRVGPDSTAFHQGMSLRDWFAGQVLVESFRRASELFDKHEIDTDYIVMASESYELADAMLAARASGSKEV